MKISDTFLWEKNIHYHCTYEDTVDDTNLQDVEGKTLFCDTTAGSSSNVLRCS